MLLFYWCVVPGPWLWYVPGGGGAPRLRLRAHQGGHQRKGETSRQEKQPSPAQPGTVIIFFPT